MAAVASFTADTEVFDAGIFIERLKRMLLRCDVGACVAVLSATAVLFGCAVSGAPTSNARVSVHSTPTPTPPPVSGGKIQHVIIVIQENRSVDNLFHGLPGADTATTGQTSNGTVVTLQPIKYRETYDLSHEHDDFLADYNGGRMNGFDLEPVHIQGGGGGGAPPYPEYAYLAPYHVAPYFQLAERFAFADRFFQTNQGPSFPAHLYLISGTASPNGAGDLAVISNPNDALNLNPKGGCDSPSDMLVSLIDTGGSTNHWQYPCFDHQTLIDLMDAKGISWTYYEPFIGGYWDGPDAIAHLRNSPTDWSRVVVPETTILSDIAAGKLPQVSWVIPSGFNSDHPGYGNGGPSWVASIANAVGRGSYWNSTAIFVVWDDWGGWYDHVPPPIDNVSELGFRVPLIIISPYAKAGYVSHQQHEFGSLLRFVEENWSLGSLGYTDARADNLSDCFNFGQAPISYQSIHALYPAGYFLHPMTRPIPPDND